MNNLSAVLEAAGRSLAHDVKTTDFVEDLAEVAQINAAYAEFFPETRPARSTVQVAGLPRGALVEIECIAVAAAAK
jgi:2-iminobutanoate/2-iminopropanoate deaminase